jgi:periplasmic protein TorT
MTKIQRRSFRLMLVAATTTTVLVTGTAYSKEWYPYPVEVWDPPFNAEGKTKLTDYTPLEKATKPWKICVSFPHMKDSYWLAADFGAVKEAEALGVGLQLVEAGGYTNLNTQISQIENCVSGGAQAVIIGAISYDGLNNLVKDIRAKGIPVIDTVNGISSPEVSAKSLVSYAAMGQKAGEYVAKLHPAGTPKVKVAWFPGPAGAGFVVAANDGFLKAIAGSAIEVVETKYGDTGKEVQQKLVEDTLQAHPDIQYIIGTAVTAEASEGLLRSRNLDGNIKLVAYYFTPGMYEGILAGRILAAPTDSTVIQGRVAVDQAVRILEGKDYLKHVGPVIQVIDASNVKTFDKESALAPAGFKAVFNVKATEK